jgi:hypothetical protein
VSYAQERRQEVLDGRRSWNKNDHAGGDSDVFQTQFVAAVRKLRDYGMFDQASEHHGNHRGIRCVDRIDILGAVNFDAVIPGEG